jgi:hypothetical protein
MDWNILWYVIAGIIIVAGFIGEAQQSSEPHRAALVGWR